MAVFLLLTIISLLATILFVVKYYFDKRKLFQLGSKLPGPKPLPIIGNAWDFLDTDLELLAKIRKYRDKYKLFVLWFGHQPHVFINTPDYAEEYCSSSKLLDRCDKIKFLKPFAGKGVIIANGEDWKKAKKLMESAFAYSSLKSFIPKFQNQSEILVRRLEKEVGGSYFSLLPYMKECGFDIIVDVALESDMKGQNSDVEILHEIDRFLKLGNKKLFNFWQQSDLLYQFMPDGREFYSLIESATRLMDEQIMKRKEERNRLKENEDQTKTKRRIFWRELAEVEGITIDEIRQHVLTLIMSAYETSSNAICFVLVMLGLHPKVQDKAYEEIISVLDGDLNDEKLHKLEYLDRVIKETLRLFPTVPISFRKATEDVQIGNHLIPAGADVSVNMYEIHRDPEQYDNPDEFNPDNFLPENIVKRHPYSYMPFLSGQRKCIGSKFAMFEIKVVTAMILRNYKIECDYKTMEDVKVRADISLTMVDGFRVKISKR